MGNVGLYESACDVAPILLLMLKYIECPKKRACIYDLLYEIGNGYAGNGEMRQLEDGSVVPLREACRAAVKRGIHIYTADAQEDSEVGHKARELIDSLSEES